MGLKELIPVLGIVRRLEENLYQVIEYTGKIRNVPLSNLVSIFTQIDEVVWKSLTTEELIGVTDTNDILRYDEAIEIDDLIDYYITHFGETYHTGNGPYEIIDPTEYDRTIDILNSDTNVISDIKEFIDNIQLSTPDTTKVIWTMLPNGIRIQHKRTRG